MSYSVTTKKRKFHRVLDSISNVSAQKPATSTADPSALSKSSSNVVAPSTPNSTTAMTTGNIMYPTIKKVRLTPGSEVDNAIVKLSKATGGSLARRHAAAASSPSSIRSSSTSRPNFVPWDRERFLERLETFRRVDRWSPKPARINEVQWAKRGWSCVDVMRVECVGGCGQAVVVKLPGDIEEGEDGYDSDKREERSEVQTKLVEKYAELIIDGHSEKCPWRKTGCDDTIQRLPLTTPETAINGLRSRYHNLARMADKLPAIESITTPETLDLDHIITLLPPDFLPAETTTTTTPAATPPPATTPSTPPPSSAPQSQPQPSTASPPPINKPALSLSLFGWDSVPHDLASDLASCSACFRRLGLWMYKPKPDGSLSVYETLDIASEHLEYCPWVNAGTQSGEKRAGAKGKASGTGAGAGGAGWELVVHALATMTRRREWDPSTATTTTGPTAVGKEDGSILHEDMRASVDGGEVEDEDVRKQRDREWWSKLRRVRQALQVKGLSKKK